MTPEQELPKYGTDMGDDLITQEGFQELLTGMVLVKVGKYITSIQADIREGKEANVLFYI